MRLTIKKKLVSGFGILIAMIAVLAVVVFSKVNDLNGSANQVLNHEVKSMQYALSTQGTIHHALSMHRGYMILGLPVLAEERIEAWNKIDQNIEELDTLAAAWDDGEAIDAYRELKDVLKVFRAAQDRIAEIAHTPENIPAETKFFNDAVPHGEDMLKYLQAVLDQEKQLESTAERKQMVKYIAAAKTHFLRAKGAITAYLVEGTETSLQKVQREVEACQASVDRLKTKVDLFSSGQRADFDRYIASRELFLAEAFKVIELRSAPDWNVAEHICLNEVTPTATRADELLDQIVTIQQSAYEESGDSLIAAGQQVLWITILTALFACGIGLAVAIVLSQKITSTLGKVVTHTQAISRKDLSVEPLDVQSRDELGDLAQATNEMQEALKEIIEEVGQATRDVTAGATQIAASSSEMAQGMQEQQAKTMTVSAAIEEMSSTISEVAGRVQEASQSSQEAGQAATDGGQVVSQTVDGINQIALVVDSASNAVKELGEKSESIGQVIEVINDIADQTNLLALNAAIEAARAGEHGRGFAVVADEVRKLADRTTKATDEIGESIVAIQTETSQAVTQISQGTEKIEEGVSLASQAGESLAAIVEGSEKVNAMIQSVATTSEQQSAVAQQVTQDVEAINLITQNSSDGAQQAASAASMLNQRAGELQGLVDQFKIS